MIWMDKSNWSLHEPKWSDKCKNLGRLNVVCLKESADAPPQINLQTVVKYLKYAYPFISKLYLQVDLFLRSKHYVMYEKID